MHKICLLYYIVYKMRGILLFAKKKMSKKNIFINLYRCRVSQMANNRSRWKKYMKPMRNRGRRKTEWKNQRRQSESKHRKES